MFDKMMEVLDENNPRWWLEWADQRDLIDYIQQTARFVDSNKIQATINIRRRVANRLFATILNAAIEAELVTSK